MVINHSKRFGKGSFPIERREIVIEGEKDKIFSLEKKLRTFQINKDYFLVSDDSQGKKTYSVTSNELKKDICEIIKSYDIQINEREIGTEEKFIVETDINKIEKDTGNYSTSEEPWWRKKIHDAEAKDTKRVENQNNSSQIKEIDDEEANKQVAEGVEIIKPSWSKSAKKNKGENFNEKQLDGKDKDNFFAKQKKEKENNVIVGDKRNNPQNKGITNKHSGIFIFVGLFSFIVGVVVLAAKSCKFK